MDGIVYIKVLTFYLTKNFIYLTVRHTKINIYKTDCYYCYYIKTFIKKMINIIALSYKPKRTETYRIRLNNIQLSEIGR